MRRLVWVMAFAAASLFCYGEPTGLSRYDRKFSGTSTDQPTSLNTTATFAGAVTICIDYSSVSYGNESVLKLLHREAAGTWVDVTTSVDPVNKLIRQHSITYEWLVVCGARAQFKGTGWIDGTGD
jgi:hypothetical protein